MASRVIAALLNKRMLACTLLGFSSGLPYYVLVSLVPAWFRTEGVSLAEIAAFSWLRVPYTWKFLWAPLLDRFSLPFLSRRRDWALLTQVALLLATAGLAWFDPRESVWVIAAIALTIAAFSASQDIAIDAYRRELLPDEELGFGNSLSVNAYRIAGLVPGGLALVIADHVSWFASHVTVAAFMAIGIGTTLWAPKVDSGEAPPSSLRAAVVGPFKEFFSRSDLESAVLLLCFLFLYKLGDNLATTLATPFYIDMGFTLTEIATLVKVVALWSMVGGSLVGGIVIARIGINRALWIFGLVQMLSILGFAALAVIGRDLVALGAAVFFEYAGVGLGTAAFVAFIARATSKKFTATQYALFSSFVALPGIAAGSLAGVIVESMGYRDFFFLCTALALPGLLMLPRIAPWSGSVDGSSTPGARASE
jgi:PAT family beta-lactamase induction signal transducer AmpG